MLCNVTPKPKPCSFSSCFLRLSWYCWQCHSWCSVGFFFFFFKFSCLFHELSVTGAFSTSVLGWAWPYYSNLQFDAWNLIWCVFGVFCTCLSFQAETASDLMGVTIFQWLCTEFTNNKEGPLHNGWFQFQLSLLQANYELSWSVLFTRMPTFSSCHDPLVRPPPAPLISPISI